MHDAVLGQRFETAGIDDQIGLAAQLAVAVMAVTGQSGLIGHQRIAGFGQAVEECRLADIRSPDEDEGGFHLEFRVKEALSGRFTNRPYSASTAKMPPLLVCAITRLP